jgi:hypothetical protein
LYLRRYRSHATGGQSDGQGAAANNLLLGLILSAVGVGDGAIPTVPLPGVVLCVPFLQDFNSSRAQLIPLTRVNAQT